MKPFNEHGTQEIKKMKVGDYALHGDVILQKIEKLPDNFDQMKKEPNDALAYGEATGHLHKLFRMTDGGSAAFALKEDTDKTKYLNVYEPVLLKHQEHSPIVVQPGCYRISIQREYDPFTKRVRQVMD